jgi:hypothetical protein
MAANAGDALYRAFVIRLSAFACAYKEQSLKHQRRFLRHWGSNPEIERSIAEDEYDLALSRKRIDWLKNYPRLSDEEREEMP